MRTGISRTRRVGLLIAAAAALFLATAAPATAGTTVTPGATPKATAAALGNCGGFAYSGDRLCLIAYGGSAAPKISHVELHVHTGPDGHDYAYADGYMAPWAAIYLDVSHDGGRTWAGWQYTHQNDGSGWQWNGTSDVYDGPGTWIRACGYGWDNRYVCTGWN